MLEKKKFLRLSYASKALKLEEEELHELDDIHGQQFAKDFSEENQFYIESLKAAQPSDTKKDTNEAIDDPVEKIDHGSAIKKIHRALARATHPDLQETIEEDEDFKIVQEAYEQGDISTLVLKAFDLGLEVELTDHELSELEKKIENQKLQIQEIKKTMKWMWAESDKSSITRRKIQVALGIDPKKFDEWLRKKNQSSPTTEGTSKT